MEVNSTLTIIGLSADIVGFSLLIREWHLATQEGVWDRAYELLSREKGTAYQAILDRIREIDSSHVDDLEDMLGDLPEPYKARVAGNRLKWLQTNSRKKWVRSGGILVLLGFAIQIIAQLI